jgi:hypothetical protein
MQLDYGNKKYTYNFGGDTSWIVTNLKMWQYNMKMVVREIGCY